MSGAPALQRLTALTLPSEDPRFDERAVCGLATAHLFDEPAADEGVVAYRRRVRKAKTVCVGCPVRPDCLQYGLANGLSGVLGGEELKMGKIRSELEAQR